MRARRVACAVLVVVLGALLACSSGRAAREPPLPEGTVRFAAYDFSENQVLVAVYAEALRRAGIPVAVLSGVATREVLLPALQQGRVDVVVDYLGTAEGFVRRGDPDARLSAEQLHASLADGLAPGGVEPLAAAPGEDRNGFAVTTEFAARHGVGRLSELSPLARALVFGGPPECPDRPLCLPGLREVYGLAFGEVVSMPSRAATVEALVAGEIDVGLLETSDAHWYTAPIMLLDDDRALQPHENVVPLVSTAVLDRWGEPLRTAVDETSARLTEQELVALNRSVEVDGLTPEEAASEWWNRQ